MMPIAVSRSEVQRMVNEGGQLVDVLPREAYEEAHLPQARSIPLKEMDRNAMASLEKERPVIVYCNDTQ